MVTDLNELQSRYGDRMQISTFGTSLDGRPLYEVTLGNPNAKKHILIHAGIHAREYMTSLLVMKQLEYGLYFYNTGSYEGVALSEMLNQVAVHYVPMVNPDGISLSQNGIDAIRSESLRQAIRQCYADDIAQGRTDKPFEEYLTRWKSNARGVDLNQNFPADWELVETCPNPSFATYRGTSALSEPESQALAALANSRDWALTISYHSMGNVIYWDYDGNKVQSQSRELAVSVLSNTGYVSGGKSGHGGFKDWLQIRENPITSITIETGSIPCPLPLSQYADIWYRNKMVWALAAKYAMTH
jgi:g-D-glutamyl-meso-diaminopimelate peptidase